MFNLYKKNPQNNIKQFIHIKRIRNKVVHEIIYKTIESISFQGGYYLDIYNRPPYSISNDKALIEQLGFKKCKAVITIDEFDPAVQKCISEKISEFKKQKI